MSVHEQCTHATFSRSMGRQCTGAMATDTGVVVSCTDAVNSGAKAWCTGFETAKTSQVFSLQASSMEVGAVDAGLPAGAFTLSGIGYIA